MKLKCWYDFQFAEIDSCFQKLNTKEAFLLRVLTFQEIISWVENRAILEEGWPGPTHIKEATAWSWASCTCPAGHTQASLSGLGRLMIRTRLCSKAQVKGEEAEEWTRLCQQWIHSAGRWPGGHGKGRILPSSVGMLRSIMPNQQCSSKSFHLHVWFWKPHSCAQKTAHLSSPWQKSICCAAAETDGHSIPDSRAINQLLSIGKAVPQKSFSPRHMSTVTWP